jgi:multiple antibiotic resistance protein
MAAVMTRTYRYVQQKRLAYKIRIEMKEHLQAVVTILALVNPVMCAEIFSNCTGNIPRQLKYKQAIKAAMTVGIILMIAAVAGISILKAFGVSLDAFSCAGGGILVWIGASMLRSAPDKSKSGISGSGVSSTSLTPLILFAASPGTVTGVITVAASHEKRFLPLTAIVGVSITLVVLALVLFISIRFSKGESNPGMAKQMISSYMGVIVIAMGVQFLLTGIRAFMT